MCKLIPFHTTSSSSTVQLAGQQEGGSCVYCHEEKSTNAIPSVVRTLLTSWVRKLPEGEWGASAREDERRWNVERSVQVKEGGREDKTRREVELGGEK